MRVNAYDRVSAGMMAAVLALCAALVLLIAWWSATRPPQPEILVPMEILGGRGGSPDGEPGESLLVESPADPSDNASPVETDVNETQVESAIEALQAQASDAVATVSEFGSSAAGAEVIGAATGVGASGGQPGSSDGTGKRRGLGSGAGPGGGGISNDQRWFIRFADESSLDEYAKQLDFFGIELGALLPDGQLVYISKLSAPTPTKRVMQTGKGEQRLYMTWQGGSRKVADAKLFEKVGVDASKGLIFHFYPERTESLLLKLEFDHARRKAIEIQRTYFAVVPKGTGYNFVVTRQTYIR